MRRILVTGSKGRLGSTVVSLLEKAGGSTVYAMDLDELDIADFSAVRKTVLDLKPDIVYHCAAWTDVDGCALDPERAVTINGLGAGNIATAAATLNAAVVYISSNEVFDGERANTLYAEYDSRNPMNPYGYSKYVGEREVAQLNPRHYIVRTSWLFAHGGKNFMQTMINAARAGKNLRVVTDEVANPTYNDDLAAAVLQLTDTRRFGTYHLVNEGAVSRWSFARYILDRAGFEDTPIARISRAEWPRPSTPPAYCGLANVAGAHLGVRLRPWREAVDAFLIREGLATA
ncbi:MAG: dTDP-4-dehydrorhamnose reductase [Chloroflexota bacterium]